MNYLRKKLGGLQQQQVPKANHGSAFNQKERQYYEMEAMLQKLLKDVERYLALMNELCQCKQSIYGYLLYFYDKQSEKRNIIDDLFKYHTHKMQKYIDRLTQDYESNLIGEIRQLLQIFPETKRITASLAAKKNTTKVKKQYYESLKHPNKRVDYTDYSELCEVDEQVRILEHAYQFSIRTVIREFEHYTNHKDSMLDRFCIRMCHSDAKLYTHLFKTSRVLRDKSLQFQYYRDYPQGLPSFFRDYSYKEDIQSSSDSDLDAPSASPFYEELSTKQELLIHTLMAKHGFKLSRIRSVLKQHPHASYERLLEILTNVKRPQSPPQANELQSRSPPKPDLLSMSVPERYVQIQSAQIISSPHTTQEINPLFFTDTQHNTISKTKLPQRKRSRTPPPPPKRIRLLKQIRSQAKAPHINSKIERSVSPPALNEQSKSINALQFSRKHTRSPMDPSNRTRQHRVHSKSFDQEEWNPSRGRMSRKHKKPPAPPRSRTPTGITAYKSRRRVGIHHEDEHANEEDTPDTVSAHFHFQLQRSATLDDLDLRDVPDVSTDAVAFKRKKQLSHDSWTSESEESRSPKLPPSDTSVTKEPLDSEDSLNAHKTHESITMHSNESKEDALNEDEWSTASPAFPRPPKNKPKKKKKIYDDQKSAPTPTQTMKQAEQEELAEKGKLLKDWMRSQGIWQLALYEELLNVNVTSPADLALLKPKECNAVIRKVKVVRFSTLKNQNSRVMAEKLLVKFEKLYKKNLKKQQK
eukprot:1081709_1